MSATDLEAVREFFELFKTPWEPRRGGRRYEVVLLDGSAPADLSMVDADLVVVYSAQPRASDPPSVCHTANEAGVELALGGDAVLPVYGGVAGFPGAREGFLGVGASRDPAAFSRRDGEGRVVRIGYDLFGEVRLLLTRGQPAPRAASPTMDLHIGLLRSLITGSGLPLAEVPAVPGGASFVACLTHDVDHASLRKHGLDRTVLGFLYRATFGSLVRAVRGRLSPAGLCRNLAAASGTPLVLLGWARDPWRGFVRYRRIEGTRPSTFFVLPAAGRAGRLEAGPAPAIRRSAYGVADIADEVALLLGSGAEVALHGIDAWLDAASGREEARAVSAVTSRPVAGTRMHWLYGNEGTPGRLGEAGFGYDSTWGYNQTVGYRAGTAQVFRPMGAGELLELPMHVMDTALFRKAYLDLGEAGAWERVDPLIQHAGREGGVLTLNWHDRSIAPERLWGGLYTRLVDELTARGAWFATASDAVAWFRKRRSVVFEERDGRLVASTGGAGESETPPLLLRVHPGGSPAPGYVERPFEHRTEVEWPQAAASRAASGAREASGCL